MTSQSGSSIRFPCPSCGGQIKIPARQAGQACRCPKCNVEITAPEAAVDARRQSSWDDDDFFGDSLPAPTQTPAPVPKPPIETTPPPSHSANSPSQPSPASLPQHPVTATSAVPAAAESSTDSGPSQPPTDTGDAFEIECDLCGATLRARRSHIGQTLPCPTCHSKIHVTDPAEAKDPLSVPPAPAVNVPDQRPARPSSPPPPSAPPDEEFGVECQLCHSLVYAKRSQMGTTIRCPDCYSDVVVKEPKRRPTAAERVAVDDDESDFRLSDLAETPSAAYLSTKQLADSVEAAGGAPPTANAAPEQRSSPPQSSASPQSPGWTATSSGAMHDQSRGYLDKARQELEEKEQQADPPPARPFTSGMLSFLFDWEAGIRWAFLVLFGYVVIAVMNIIVMSEDVHPLFRLMMIVILTPIGLIYLDCAAVCFLAIVQDTSSGFDKIKNWPGLNFLDWMFDGFYIINCLWVSSLVGVLAGVFVGCLSYFVALLLGMVSMAVLFPILFMSVLEQGSPLGMASPSVWQSLKSQRRLWIAFYLRSLGIVLAAAALMALYLIPWFIVQFLSVGLLVTLSLVYFRLIGRLAWCLDEEYDLESGKL